MKKLLPFLFILLHLTAYSQTIKVTGKITDETDEPLIGGFVVEKGTTNGSVADINGEYSIEVKPSSTLTFSYIGFKSKDIDIAGRTIINVSLEEDIDIIDEPGFFIYTPNARHMDMSTANTKIMGYEYLLGRPNNTETLFNSHFSGLYAPFWQNYPTVNVRGNNIDGSVKYVVNGIAGAPFNPADVSRIWISKDPASATVYGNEYAAGGIVHVETKTYAWQKTRIEANAWLGLNNLNSTFPNIEFTVPDSMTQTGLLQHYDFSLFRKEDHFNFNASVSYDHAEKGIQSLTDEKLTAKADVILKLFKWMSFNQNVFYSQANNNYGILTNTTFDSWKYHMKEKIFLTSAIDLDLRYGLKIKSVFTYNESNIDSDYPLLTAAYINKPLINYRNKNYMWDNSVNTSIDLRDSHYLYVSGGFNYKKSLNGFHEETTNTLLRAAYNYQTGKRTATASIRQVTSSLNSDILYLPAFSAGWNISDERFFNRDIVDKLKLRASWGKTAIINTFENNYGIMVYPFDYDDFKWQKTTQTQFGIDVQKNINNYSSFDHFISLTTNYFYKKTDNILRLNNIREYATGLVTKGWEFEASYGCIGGYYVGYLGFDLKANLTLNNQEYTKKQYVDFTPDYFYGINLTVRWEKLALSGLLQSAKNAQFITYTATPQKIDYTSIKYLNLSYSPRIKYYNLNIYVNIENLYTWSAINAGNNYINYPLYRIYSIGVKITLSK